MSARGGPRAVAVPCVCLVVLDGWGLAPAGPGNAVSLAHTPVFDKLWASYPHTTLTAYGPAVGLPEGQMGNSEVGHLNLGAGSVVKQDLVRIDEAIADGSLARNEVLRRAFAGPRIHLLGLVSDGGVHSSLEHLRALIALGGELAPAADMVVHAFTDGRDTLPHAGAGYLAELDGIVGARVGSVVGRYWAMDRDRRWDRTQRAYDMLVHGRAPQSAATGEQAVREAYARGETDEFIEPTLVGEEALIRPGDSVLCFNFRPDRMREIVRALAEPDFGESPAEQLPGWEGRGGASPVDDLATLTEYEEGWPYPVAFAPQRPEVTLSEVIARSGARQLHVAETEKYPHVTYFFNGGEETPCEGERRELVPSPRDVPTYDHKPQMSAHEAATAFVGAWGENGAAGLRFGVINFANADMVGHTGVLPAVIRAVETVDTCIARVLASAEKTGSSVLITADHGNSEMMIDPATGGVHTAHTTNPVPLVAVGARTASLRTGGALRDVAPTVLGLLGIESPAEMTGRDLRECD
jgi:2,3-bisphosphoglycerate-independent phosphoglycerate mutase